MSEDHVLPPPAAEMSAVSINSPSDTVHRAAFSQRVPIRSIVGRPDGGAGLAGQTVLVGGWVKTGREQGKGSFAFLELSDGSCAANLQVIVDAALAPLAGLVLTGTCVSVEGELKTPPEGAKQKVELRVTKVLEVGSVDPAKYPIPKTKLTLEFLRDFVHLRPRTNTISAVARIRNELAYATHTFFRNHGFLYVHTPIITTSDCEGAGEMFQVTTLINHAEKMEKELMENPPPTEDDVHASQSVVEQRAAVVNQLKAAKASKEEIGAAVSVLKQAKEDLKRVEERANLKPGLPKKDGKTDYSLDFFARQAFLTVSGQLQVESYACAVSSVYTFGPTFRAENSHTSRHLAEFWMVEPEIAFADLQDDMNCAEAYVKFLCQWLLDNCYDDMEFVAKNFDKECIERLRMVATTPFERITYTQAVELLKKAAVEKEKDGKPFQNEVEWGIDLASEHERHLTEEIFKKPVIVYNYPKGIKAFYMRLNDDNKTVAAMDVLVPHLEKFNLRRSSSALDLMKLVMAITTIAALYLQVGELIGGSQREERLDVIQKRITEMGLALKTIRLVPGPSTTWDGKTLWVRVRI